MLKMRKVKGALPRPGVYFPEQLFKGEYREHIIKAGEAVYETMAYTEGEGEGYFAPRPGATTWDLFEMCSILLAFSMWPVILVALVRGLRTVFGGGRKAGKAKRA